MPERVIVAMGGGGFSMEPSNPLLDEFVLSLARQARPRVCFVPTASGDSEWYIGQFYRAFAKLDCRASHLQLFARSVRDLHAFVREQDVVYVGGGSTANLLAIWRLHGLDEVLREASEEGVVLAGTSAGMKCWFEQCLTDSFDVNDLDPLDDGLGFVAGSACAHYDGEPKRRPAFRTCVARGVLRDGWAADDGAALVFADGVLTEVVSSRPAAAAYRVTRAGSEAHEERLDTRYLG
jgi:peptidase E